MITGAQIRAARELLGWRQAELAKRARIQAHAVESAESSLGQSFVPGQDMQAMRAVLEAAGVEFTNGDEPGVKLNARGRASNSAAGSAKGTERPVYRSIKSV